VNPKIYPPDSPYLHLPDHHQCHHQCHHHHHHPSPRQDGSVSHTNKKRKKKKKKKERETKKKKNQKKKKMKKRNIRTQSGMDFQANFCIGNKINWLLPGRQYQLCSADDINTQNSNRPC
jgi:hypothetical protein